MILFQANVTLAFLQMMTGEEKVARCFSRSPLSTRAAAAVSVVLLTLFSPPRSAQTFLGS